MLSGAEHHARPPRRTVDRQIGPRYARTVLKCCARVDRHLNLSGASYARQVRNEIRLDNARTLNRDLSRRLLVSEAWEDHTQFCDRENR